MKYISNGIKLILVTLIVFTAGCASSGNTERSRASASSSEDYMTLEDHLRRINGVSIVGSGNNAKVVLRGTRGISTVSRGLGPPTDKKDLNLRDSDQRQPLFVLDGQKVGRDYSDIRDMLGTGEVESVKLLTESQASRYGSESGYGVIEITTRSGSGRKNRNEN